MLRLFVLLLDSVLVERYETGLELDPHYRYSLPIATTKKKSHISTGTIRETCLCLLLPASFIFFFLAALIPASFAATCFFFLFLIFLVSCFPLILPVPYV